MRDLSVCGNFVWTADGSVVCSRPADRWFRAPGYVTSVLGLVLPSCEECLLNEYDPSDTSPELSEMTHDEVLVLEVLEL